MIRRVLIGTFLGVVVLGATIIAHILYRLLFGDPITVRPDHPPPPSTARLATAQDTILTILDGERRRPPSSTPSSSRVVNITSRICPLVQEDTVAHPGFYVPNAKVEVSRSKILYPTTHQGRTGDVIRTQVYYSHHYIPWENPLRVFSLLKMDIFYYPRSKSCLAYLK